MSNSNSNNSANSTPTTTVPDEWKEIPCVQYGFPTGKGPIRTPKLQAISDPIPENATTVSPIYGLTRDQFEDMQGRDNPYEIGGYTSIATKIQDECEADDRVLYPIHIESDKLRDLGPAPLIEWFTEFVQDYLNVPYHTCRRYYSGNRSIHVHVPRFVSGEGERKRLKEMAETFCETTGAELDCGLYSAKRMFRLPGVEHEKTGIPKLEIDGKWDNRRLAHKVKNASPSVPESYVEVLQHVFASQESLIVSSPKSPLDDPQALFRILDSKKTILELEPDKPDIETPLIEQEAYPDDTANAIEWLQYNAKEFSPYALADGNSRSVAVVNVKGTPFARKEVTVGNRNRPVHALIPAYFYGARGCAGEEFTKDHAHAPLQLSKPDYEKWDYEVGEDVVVIGGKSNRSRIFRVDPWQATVVGHALTGEDASRQAALDYLENEGYDVGKAGSSGKATTSKPTRTRHSETQSHDNEETEAAKLQRQAECNGIDTLTHTERGRVACRLLKQGWGPAWDWFREQFGTQFKPVVTWEQFNSVVTTYPDKEYRNIEVPPKPR